ncbi:ATP synthase F1 subunit epsilon [Candidatus Auribacterota bacterium]
MTKISDHLFVEIITPQEKVFEGKADSILIPSEDGDIFILPSHLPMMCALKKGEVTLHLENKVTQQFEISSGILEIDNDKIKLITDTAQAAKKKEKIVE